MVSLGATRAGDLWHEVVKRTAQFSVHLVGLAQASVIAALLPFALGTLSRSRVVFAGSAILSVTALLIPFWSGRLASLGLSLILWLAALLVAASGLRAKRTDQRARLLEDRLVELNLAQMAHQRQFLQKLRSEPHQSSALDRMAK